MNKNQKIKLALFASGNGSNVQQISEYFSHHPMVEVDCLIYNKTNAYAAQRAQQLGVTAQYYGREGFANGQVLRYLQDRHIDWIILAGFLWLMPQDILESYHNRIINIHPSLLPRYGGKGMYGMHVHRAVIENGETQSGITIHMVDTEYDKGQIIFQAECPVMPQDTPETLAERIHDLERIHFPRVIESHVTH